MKSALIFAASLAGVLIASAPACAWDPSSDEPWSPPESQPDPAPLWSAPEPPPGIYLVTETYVDDVVVRSGPTTVYATETMHETTGTYARVLESVGTGGRSDFDGAAFNGRAALADGRSVAGTYYENFIRTDSGFVAVSIVFFQDDEETARAARVDAPAVAPSPGDTLVTRTTPVTAPPPSGAVGRVTPVVDSPEPVGPVALPPSWPAPVVVPGTPASISLPDRAIEVLRARRVSLSFSDPGMVRWRFAGGDAVVLGPVEGTPTQPFIARWDRLPPVGGAWVVRFLIDPGDGTTRSLAVRVTVRAPGLVE